MANEEAPETFLNYSKASFEDYSEYYLQNTYSDVTFVVEEENVQAHKIILSKRCQFFETLLKEAPEQTLYPMDNIPKEAFKTILKYIYTGNVVISVSNLSDFLDTITVAKKFSFQDLEARLIDKIQEQIEAETVCWIFNAASSHNLTELEEACVNFLEQNASYFTRTDHLLKLSQRNLVKFLQRDTLGVPEIEVFDLVEKWCNRNDDQNRLARNCVRLSYLHPKDVTSRVWPSKLFDNDVLLHMIQKHEDGKVPLCRSCCKRNCNVADPKSAKLIFGKETAVMTKTTRSICASCSVGDENGITVDLGLPYHFNNIKIKLHSFKNVIYGHRYYIQSSVDNQNWTTILDYSGCDCCSLQDLFFEKIIGRFVRIVCVFASNETEFHVVNLKIYLQDDVPSVVNQIVRPSGNVATLTAGARVIEGYGSYILGVKLEESYQSSSASCTYHKVNEGSIVIQLAQPYLISNLKLLLDTGPYQYYIETSLDRTKWKTVIDRRSDDCGGLQHLEFHEETPCVYIRIVGSSSTLQVFKCYYLECFNNNQLN